MKIAIVLPYGFTFCAKTPNSIETVIRTLNTPLLDNDEIIVICTEGAQQSCRIPIHKIPKLGKKKYNLQIVEFLKSQEFDLIEVHQGVKMASFIANKIATPTILYKHNYIKATNPIEKFLNEIALMPLKAIISVSNAANNDFIQTFPRFKNRAFAIPNSIDLTKWPLPDTKKESIIFFAGRAIAQKGLAELCDGLKLILNEFTDWRAVLILSKFKENAAFANAQIAKLDGVKDRVTILADQPLETVINEQSKAKIAIVPSKFKEPFGLVALEAHALGCALISSGSGGLREASGDNAIFLNELNGKEIYNATEYLIKNPKIIEKLVKNGREYIEKNHSLNTRITDLVNLRHKILLLLDKNKK